MNNQIETESFCLRFPENYTVLDLETTGLRVKSDFIIEIGAIKIRSGKEYARFSTLIQSPIFVSDFVQNLTGITNNMLKEAPAFSEISDALWDFLKDEFLVGHNIGFDISFLHQAFLSVQKGLFLNSCMDTLLLSKKLFPEFIHHRLVDLASYYKIDTKHAHRAVFDCQMNYQVFESMKQTILSEYDSYDSFISWYPKLSGRTKAAFITSTIKNKDQNHPLYGRYCVITGALSSCSRKEAMQRIADLGGINQDKVNTLTNMLILGDNSFYDQLSAPTKKQKKAEMRMEGGQDIRIISETVFHTICNKNL